MAEKLGDILGRIQSGVGRTVKICNLLSMWRGMVDERVGKNTEATKIKNRTLYVSTSSSAWAHELSYLKTDFISKFNKEAGGDVVNDIIFRSI